MTRCFMFVLLLLALAACAPATPTLPATEAPPGVEWDTRPEAVVFRLDIAGSSSDRASDLNAVPYCTIYGDGHVIWQNPGTNPEEFLETLLDEATLRAFLDDLVFGGFYTWQPQHTGTPERDDGPPRERISLNLFGETHWLDSTANWPGGTFAGLHERCRQFTASPVLYVPTGAWISALPTRESSNRVLPWSSYSAEFGGLRLADIPPDSPRWVTEDTAASAWTLARRGRVLLTEDGQDYRLVVQVPGLQPEAPPAPR